MTLTRLIKALVAISLCAALSACGGGNDPAVSNPSGVPNLFATTFPTTTPGANGTTTSLLLPTVAPIGTGPITFNEARSYLAELNAVTANPNWVNSLVLPPPTQRALYQGVTTIESSSGGNTYLIGRLAMDVDFPTGLLTGKIGDVSGTNAFDNQVFLNGTVTFFADVTRQNEFAFDIDDSLSRNSGPDATFVLSGRGVFGSNSNEDVVIAQGSGRLGGLGVSAAAEAVRVNMLATTRTP